MPERGSAFAIRIALFLLNLLGYWIVALILVPAVLYFFLTGRAGRRASRLYFQRLYEQSPDAAGKPSLWKSYLHHLCFGLITLDRFSFWQNRLSRFEFHRTGYENLNRSGKKGAVLLGAHLGSFDALRALSVDENHKIHVVMNTGNARKLNSVLNELNSDTNLRVIELKPGDLDAIFELKARVDEGEMVAILGDRLPEGNKKRVTWVPFLGKPAPFPQNVWILAHLLECPVFLTIGYRAGFRRYHVFCEPLFDKVELPRKQRAERLEYYISRYAQRLDELCRQCPYQWFNFFDFWSLD